MAVENVRKGQNGGERGRQRVSVPLSLAFTPRQLTLFLIFTFFFLTELLLWLFLGLGEGAEWRMKGHVREGGRRGGALVEACVGPVSGVVAVRR